MLNANRLSLIVFVGAVFIPALCLSELVKRWAHCPEIDDYIVPNLNLTAFMGTWYEIERFPAPFEAGQSCVFAQYTLMKDSETGEDYVKVNNTGYTGENYESAIGKATEYNPPTGALVVHFDSNPFPQPNKPNYNLLALDTDQYALVYSCDKFFFIDFEFAWILSRDRTLGAGIVKSLKDRLTEVGADSSLFSPTIQENCP